MLRKCVLLTLLLLSLAAEVLAGGLQIIDKPIVWTEHREQLIREYAQTHYGLNKVDITPQAVVVHWTASSTWESAYKHFYNEDLGDGTLNVASHFLVDRDGKVFRLTSETALNRHAIGYNWCAIGIENVGGTGGAEDLTKAQLEANIALIKYLQEKYPDIITANMNGTPYYTNSSHLPVGYTEDIFSALDIQDELQTLYTSGTVFHAFLGEKLPDWKSAASLVRKIAENYKLPYYTLSPTYSICQNHGYISGEAFKCPDCGGRTEVYSRITGYYRPVQNWNDGKAQEYQDRKVYSADIAIKHNPAPKAAAPAAHAADCGCGHAHHDGAAKLTLFTTSTCPNCKIAKSFLDKAGLGYDVVVSDQDPDAANAMGIRQAPTLVLQDGGNVTKFTNLSEIRRYIEQRA